MASSRRAVVIGGGIGGLAAGVALHRAGWDVQVLERSPQVEAIGAGVTLVRNAVRALEALGVGTAVRAAGQVDVAGGTREPSGRWLWRMDQSTVVEQLGTSSLGIHRATLHRILADALPARGVWTGAEVIGVRPGTAGTRAEVDFVRDGATTSLTADLVVAADGINSRTRAQLWPDAPAPRYIGSTAWRGVTRPWADAAEVTFTWGPGSEFGMVPLGDGRIYWYGAVKAPRGQTSPDEMAAVRRRFGSWHDPIPALFAATEPTAVLRHDLYDLVDPLPTYVLGRVALLGDAAHAMPPYLGQGACQALEDAVVLGAYCSGTDAVEDALRRYDADRRPRTQLIAQRSRRIGRFGQQLSNPLAIAVRNAMLRLIPPRIGLKPLSDLTNWHPPEVPAP